MDKKELEEAVALLKENEHHPFLYELKPDGIHYYFERTPLTNEEIISHIEEQIEDFKNWIEAADRFLKALVSKSSSEIPQVSR